MKSRKPIVIIIIIILIIIGIIIALLLNLKNNRLEEPDLTNNVNDFVSSEIYDYENTTVEQVYDQSSFFTVNNCISDYLNMINRNNSAYFAISDEGRFVRIIEDKDIANKVLNILDRDYINQNNITKDNLWNFIDNVEKDLTFIPLKMNIFPGRQNEKYSVYGMIVDSTYNLVKYSYFIVTLDVVNNTYSLQPINEKYNNINDINLENQNLEIEKNINNSYTIQNIDNEYISDYYFQTFKKMALSNPNLAYKYLNKEYRDAKFGSSEKFKEQIKPLKSASLDKYLMDRKLNCIQYICLDKNGNYYIFQETAPMQYTVILDTYTIDLPEFIEKYEKANNKDKVLMNIQRFFDAIDDGDYKYAYNKLDETYKANNFKTQLDFENYVKNTFFEKNKLAAGTVEKQDDIYLYKVKISDETGIKTNEVTKTFVMQLKEGTDFVMSFSVN